MKRLTRKTGRLSMPAWLRGAIELIPAAVISVVLAVIPVAAAWLTGGFANRGAESAARLAGQGWLVMHGVPLVLAFPEGAGSEPVSDGLFHVVPLGLTLIPLFLAWGAGRRLARASYTNRFWQALAGAMGIYALIGAGIAYYAGDAYASAPLFAAALIPAVCVGVGIVTGAYREAGGWGPLIGADVTSWAWGTSRNWWWAGSYVWSVLRAGFLAVVASVGFSAVLFAVAVALHWAEIVYIFERIDAGIAGSTVLTILQLGLLPNLVVWTLAWVTGAGFSLGTGSSLTPMGTSVGPLPAFPVLGALPVGQLEFGYAALAIPVVAGLLAGWWCSREGKNQLTEWLLVQRVKRWFTALISTLCLGVLVGLAAGIGGAALALLSRASLGLGRFTDLGPNPFLVGLFLAAEVSVGVIAGYATGSLWKVIPRLRDRLTA